MLFIIFQAGMERYAIATSHVVEVLPAVAWTPVAGTATGVIGILNYHGAPIPLVDALLLLCGDTMEESSRDITTRLRMRSRILLVRPDDDGMRAEGVPVVGVLVDCVVNIERHDASDFVERGTVATGAPCLGPVLTDGDGIVQRIEPAHILPAAVREEMIRQWASPQ